MTTTPSESNPARRTLLTAGAWSVPIIATGAVAPFAAASCGETGTITFNGGTAGTAAVTGTWIVPPCISRITVSIAGGGGGAGRSFNGQMTQQGRGAAGALVTVTLNVTPGQTFNVIAASGGRSGPSSPDIAAAGGQGYGNGGNSQDPATPASISSTGGAGGAGSALRLGTTLVAVAGGGGGGGSADANASNANITGIYGGNGASPGTATGGGSRADFNGFNVQQTGGASATGATGGAAGVAGTANNTNIARTFGTAGGNSGTGANAGGNGGTGASVSGTNSAPTGSSSGGGGGGYAGGGGGSAARIWDTANSNASAAGSGGGAGSNFVVSNPTLIATSTQGVASNGGTFSPPSSGGSGFVTISWPA
ncbi:hypothetical protein [Pseudoclavibacter sp. AY1F1]|uniref:hypothetical protein n=1 Tax=Pseudoclavibacter sp. AY1F1 TaxID=2080583 RepID=UPI0011B04D06|nr:hypothetical protein [Pseudoclavibacter sp. AY1F1]